MMQNNQVTHIPGQPRPAVIVLAKAPRPGRVKTRLSPTLTPAQAAAVHAAMLICVLQRTRRHVPGEHVLAVDGLETWQETRIRLAHDVPLGTELAAALVEAAAGWRLIDQGTGDLGARLEHTWRDTGAGAVVFLGVDTPDVPAAALEAVVPALADVDAAIGPASDGGYWTLAARRHAPALLRGIDWGGSAVYHQTLAAAAREGLTWRSLPTWHDVDEPADLAALRHRLNPRKDPRKTLRTDPPLRQLRNHLACIAEATA